MNADRNEAQTRLDLINPAVKRSGWGVDDRSSVKVEVIAPGRILGARKTAPKEKADYVLVHNNQKLAVIEAKREGLPVTEGLAQAKKYCSKLNVRFGFSTNGHGIYRVDMETGEEGYVDSYPSPEELWKSTFGQKEAKERDWHSRFSAVPFEDKGGQWQPRYYQHNAISKALDVISKGQDRILLTLATGTGKTAIAFQIAWKLFHSRWNLKDWKDGLADGKEPSRRPRILFLADRNILADQAFNSFGAFAEDALVRIAPSEIRKKGHVPKNGSIFFTIFQTFMSGSDENGDPAPYFGAYPENFFDFIVIDECHRGGANDESNWRAIMEHFSPAVQLGLTATPKRTSNVDTYEYFGEPVYIYSLKEGINDGYLTPFKVKQISTTLDDYVYTSDDDVVEGEIEEKKLYTEPDFNKIIEIKERESKRVSIFMDDIDQNQKTLVFCATQVHALAIRDLINRKKESKHADYCVRVTANDGAIGETFLRTFQDNEKTIPTILTTSQKLSTGVDARNVRNIVLLRPVNSMIEFKQIVGRGTRLFDGKEYFTVYDFVDAYHHFSDPEWDGEPAEPVEVSPRAPRDPDVESKVHEPEDESRRKAQKIKVKLADGKERTIQHMMATSFWNPDGTPMSAAEFMSQLFGELPDLFKNEAELRALWSQPGTRQQLLEGLEEKGFGGAQLAELSDMIDAQDSDLYDVLAYIAFRKVPVSRRNRVSTHRELLMQGYSEMQREFVQFVLDQYVSEGVGELALEKLKALLDLKYHNINDAISVLGPAASIKETFVGFQKHLYVDS